MSDLPEALPNPNPSGSDVPPEVSLPTDPVSLARHYERDDVDARIRIRHSKRALFPLRQFGCRIPSLLPAVESSKDRYCR